MQRPRGPPARFTIITYHRRTMNTQQMFVITKSGITIRPEGVELSMAYTRHFIRDGQEKLVLYRQEAAQARTIAPEGPAGGEYRCRHPAGTDPSRTTSQRARWRQRPHHPPL